MKKRLIKDIQEFIFCIVMFVLMGIWFSIDYKEGNLDKGRAVFSITVFGFCVVVLVIAILGEVVYYKKGTMQVKKYHQPNIKM